MCRSMPRPLGAPPLLCCSNHRMRYFGSFWSSMWRCGSAADVVKAVNELDMLCLVSTVLRVRSNSHSSEQPRDFILLHLMPCTCSLFTDRIKRPRTHFTSLDSSHASLYMTTASLTRDTSRRIVRLDPPLVCGVAFWCSVRVLTAVRVFARRAFWCSEECVSRTAFSLELA
jgi:hypothetical protein